MLEKPKKFLSIDMAYRLVFDRGLSIGVENVQFETPELERAVRELNRLQTRQQELWEDLAKMKRNHE